ncbi:MAG: ABC transporter ATP-binding protein [Bacilli bacterium]
MKTVIKYLKKSFTSILLIITLLVVQAMCDLSLPDFTSKIINVGVQQGGIEEVSPVAIRKKSLDEILLFVDSSKKSLVLNNYHLVSKDTLSNNEYHKLVKKYPVLNSEDLYIRNTLSKEELSSLNSELSRPMLVRFMLTGTGAESIALQNNIRASLPKELINVPILEVFKLMPESELKLLQTEMSKAFNSMPSSIVDQSAIASIKAEYQAMGMKMDKVQTNYILLAGLKMLGLALLSMASTVGVGFFGARTAARLARDLRNGVFKHTLSFGTTEFKKFGVASLITRTTNDIQQVQMMMLFMLRTLFYAPIIGIGGVIKVLNTNTTMAWIIAVAVMSILSLMLLVFVLVMPKFERVQKLLDKLNLVTREILNGIPVIRAFSNQRQEEKRFDSANRNLQKTTLFVNCSMSVLMPTIMFIMNAICILIVWKGAHGINSGIMQVGDMLAFIQYTMQIIMAFMMVAMFSIMFPRANVSAGRIEEVLKTKISVLEPVNPKTFSKRIKGLVEFKDVGFRYPDSDEDVLTDITFTATPGTTTAFIGSTGSGKSTLINLIPRLFDVTEGEILVDGVNIKDVSTHDLHEKIGFVPQKGILFSGTIASNLRYGNKNATDSDIEKAASIAQAQSFIEEKEEKYLSPISEGGTNVSGGQKQRLSIARAIAVNPEIYVFDDSFSALDFKTDKELRKALNKEITDATILIVAQRISTIMQADQIIVLNEGKIVGTGTHKELLESCQVYQEIASSQLTKEELENE